jgi:hypothetical protein
MIGHMPSTAPNTRLRSSTTDDAAFIVELARHACVIEDTQTLLPGSDDIALIAEDETGVRAGAVWTFHHDPPLLLDPDGLSLPEVAIAVVPELRGNGVTS